MSEDDAGIVVRAEGFQSLYEEMVGLLRQVAARDLGTDDLEEVIHESGTRNTRGDGRLVLEVHFKRRVPA